MTAVVYRVANDAGAPPVAVTLYQDAIPVNLTAATIACYLQNFADSADIIEITGLSGTALGVVSTPFAQAKLIAGTYSMEWEVTGGATYPADGDDRPTLIVRPEVS